MTDRSAEVPAVELRGVSVRFGRTTALAELSVSVGVGKTLALLGPSGSGKSTALKAVAGFLRPASGRVLLAGRDVTDLPPHRRGLGVVVQSYALFPHLRVRDNVAFGLRARRLPRREVTARVAEALAMVGMSGYADRLPRQLSGGQQQRVAIARALAIRPPVLLLDEPLSALDAALRADMVAELQRLRRELPDTAIIHVTHDQSEALALADHIAVMRDAALVETGPAQRLYHQPRHRFTAEFLGAANLLPVHVLDSVADSATVEFAGQRYLGRPTGPLAVGDAALLAVRPHRVGVRAGAAAGGGVPAVLAGAQWHGTGYRLDLDLAAGQRIRAEVSTLDELPTVGGTVEVHVPDDCPLVPAEGAGG